MAAVVLVGGKMIMPYSMNMPIIVEQRRKFTIFFLCLLGMTIGVNVYDTSKCMTFQAKAEVLEVENDS